MEKEEWKSIPHYEGFYEVSNWGRIRSVSRNIVTKRGVVQNRRGVLLKTQRGEDGFITVSLSKNGNRERIYVSDLVASVWRNVSSIDTNKRFDKPIQSSKKRLNNSPSFETKAQDLFSELEELETTLVKLSQTQIADMRRRFNENKATIAQLAAEYRVPENKVRNIIKTNRPIYV